MKHLLLAIYLISCGISAFASQPEIHTGKVMSQDIETEQRGAAVIPLNGSLIAAPIMRRTDIVVIETSKARMTWIEQGNGKHFVVLPVNGTVNFYLDGNACVVLDSNKKKHKFSVVHIEAIQNGAK